MVIYSASNHFGRFLGLTRHESTATSLPLPLLRDVGASAEVSDNDGSASEGEDKDGGASEGEDNDGGASESEDQDQDQGAGEDE